MAKKTPKATAIELNPFTNEVVTNPTEIEVSQPIKLSHRQVLRQLNGPGSPRIHRCIFDRMIIGRADDADVFIDAADMSRKHAVLERVGNEYRCTDLDSRHGLLLNGVKVHSCVLRPGDRLQLGSIVFQFSEGDG